MSAVTEKSLFEQDAEFVALKSALIADGKKVDKRIKDLQKRRVKLDGEIASAQRAKEDNQKRLQEATYSHWKLHNPGSASDIEALQASVREQLADEPEDGASAGSKRRRGGEEDDDRGAHARAMAFQFGVYEEEVAEEEHDHSEAADDEE